jgi:hypothetical protein
VDFIVKNAADRFRRDVTFLRKDECESATKPRKNFIWPDDLSKRIFAFLGATPSREIYIAMVWGRTCRLDHLHAFFSGALTRRVYLCTRSQQQRIELTNAGLSALRAAAHVAGVVNLRGNRVEFPADSRVQLETQWSG